MPGMPKAGTLLQRRPLGKLNRLLQRNHCVLSGSSERSIRLSAVAPDAATDPLARHSFANRINRARTITVGNDTWVRHPDGERVLALLDIARIYTEKATRIRTSPARGCGSFICPTTSTSRAALLVPSGFHDLDSLPSPFAPFLDV
jgi:hypothetical protein